MKLLVTGGAGYIGGVVVAQLVEAGHEVTVVDDLFAGHADILPEQVACHVLDIHEVGNGCPDFGFAFKPIKLP